jgi:hypothetical protein
MSKTWQTALNMRKNGPYYKVKLKAIDQAWPNCRMWAACTLQTFFAALLCNVDVVLCIIKHLKLNPFLTQKLEERAKKIFFEVREQPIDTFKYRKVV